MQRSVAVTHLRTLLEKVEKELMPVPVRELWVYGDIALGLDPIDRLKIYLTKDIYLRNDEAERSQHFENQLGVKGIGRTIRVDWAERHPDLITTNENGYASPEKCLAAHLLPDDEPIHLEVCNTSFESNVTQRLEAAEARSEYTQIIDPRGVCLWIDGQHSPTAIDKLEEGSFAFPTLPDALSMLGMSPEAAAEAAKTLSEYHNTQSGITIRGDVV